MENEAYCFVRIENARFGRKGIIATAIVFFGSFLLFCIIGSAGPDVLVSSNAGSVQLLHGLDSTEWKGNIVNMKPQHQLFWLNAIFKPVQAEFVDEQEDVELTMDITVDGEVNGATSSIIRNHQLVRELHCNKYSCNPVLLFSETAVHYSTYHISLEVFTPSQFTNSTIEMSFSLFHVNAVYTRFELAWKYLFLIISLAVLAMPKHGFLNKLLLVPKQLWSMQQKWVLMLLFALIFFNDPFFAAQIYTTSTTSLLTLYIIFLCTFICLMLGFWLAIFQEFKSNRNSDRDTTITHSPTTTSVLPTIIFSDSTSSSSMKTLLPKALLLFLIWIITISLYVYYRLHSLGDPTYDGVGDGKLMVAEGLLVFLFCVYMMWLIILAIYSSLFIKAMSLPFKFLYAITCGVILALFIGVLVGAFDLIPSRAVEFLAFYALFNLYIWTLAFSYSPDSDDSMVGHHELDDDGGEEEEDSHHDKSERELVNVASSSSSQQQQHDDDNSRNRIQLDDDDDRNN